MRPYALRIGLALLTLAVSAKADSVIYSTGFETFAPGTINAQDSWQAINGDAANMIEILTVKSGGQALEINTALATTPNLDTGAGRIISYAGTDEFVHVSLDCFLGNTGNPSFWIPLRIFVGPSGAETNALRFNVDQNGNLIYTLDQTPTNTGIVVTKNTWHH
jgi:hypothetical protein